MYRKVFSVSFALAALLAGCATPVSTKIQPSAANIAKYHELTDINVVATLERNVNEAKAADMPFLAPNYFKEASQALSECKNQLGNQPKDVLAKNAARGDAILEKGRAMMAIVKYRFAQELELKARLDALNTATLLPKDYKNTMGDFSTLIEKVEREKPGNIDQDKEQLLKALENLEVKAVQQGALHETEAINAESKKKDAEKQAPVTFAEAQGVYEDAKKQIAASPRDSALVQRLGAQALFAARHARQVNERVTQLTDQLNVSPSGGAGMSVGAAAGSLGAGAGIGVGGSSKSVEKATVEKIVLQEEDRLHAISEALGVKDLRDLALDKQVAEIKRVAAELAGSNKGAAMQDLETKLKAANDATQQATAQLAAREKQLKDQSAQLADRDAQIAALNAKLNASAQPAPRPQASKPKAPKTKATKQQKAPAN